MKLAHLIFTVILLLGNAELVGAQQCGTLNAESASSLISYLDGVKNQRQDAQCIAFAIKQLGEQRHEPATRVLTKFLDFTLPGTLYQKQRYLKDAPDPAGITAYPAATALEQIGESALPAVVEAMKSGSLSRVGLETAVTVWMTLHKGKHTMAVASLKQEADASKKNPEKDRLYWAALKATQWCSPDEEAQCRAVIIPPRSK